MNKIVIANFVELNSVVIGGRFAHSFFGDLHRTHFINFGIGLQWVEVSHRHRIIICPGNRLQSRERHGNGELCLRRLPSSRFAQRRVDLINFTAG